MAAHVKECGPVHFDPHEKKVYEKLKEDKSTELADLYCNGLEILDHNIDHKIQMSAYNFREFMGACAILVHKPFFQISYLQVS